VRVETEAGAGLCLDPHDLVISKYAAAREKDRDYVRAALRHRLVAEETLLHRLDQTTLDLEQRERLRRVIRVDAADAR
jgi:hypothetical protein